MTQDEIPINGSPEIEAVVNGPTDLDLTIEKHPKLRPLDVSYRYFIRSRCLFMLFFSSFFLADPPPLMFIMLFSSVVCLGNE